MLFSATRRDTPLVNLASIIRRMRSPSDNALGGSRTDAAGSPGLVDAAVSFATVLLTPGFSRGIVAVSRTIYLFKQIISQNSNPESFMLGSGCRSATSDTFVFRYFGCTIRANRKGDIMDGTAVFLGVIGAILSAISILAIYYGPINALKIQRKLDEEREARTRKVNLFKTLMSLRIQTLSPAYVQALNLIDVEFTSASDKEKAVRDAWKELLDLLTDYKIVKNAEEKALELRVALLWTMGDCLGYKFDKVTLRKGAYYPEWFNTVELEQHSLRQQVLELLDGSGRRKLPIAMFEQKFPDLIDQPAQKAVPAEPPKEKA